MTVAENVEYGLKVKRVPKEDRRTRVAEALETVRLPQFGERKPSQLSGGQRQRVALARALVNRPRVLLLDEPLGALDLKLREEMQIELKRIQQEVGITFIYVTHDQDEALTMSDRIAVFSHGRIDQVGTPVEVYEHPATEFVAGFVGVSNMLERDGRRFTVRPEKIRLLAEGEQPKAGRTDGKRRSAGGGVSGLRDAVHRRSRRGRCAHRRQAERRRHGGRAGPAGAARLAARAHVRDRTTGGKGGHRMKKVRRKHLGYTSLVAAVAALAFLAAGCGGDGDSRKCIRRLAAPGPRLDARGDPGECEDRGRGQHRAVADVRDGSSTSSRRRPVAR